MLYTINEVPTTCTAKHITGWYHKTLDPWSGRNIDFKNKEKFEKWLYDAVKDFARTASKVGDPSRSRTAYWTDHAFVFVTIPNDQLEAGNKYVLEALGFEKVFTGVKDRYESREKDHGALHMFCANPGVLRDKITSFLKDYESRYTKKANRAAREKFLPITKNNLVENRIITAGSNLTNTISFSVRMTYIELEKIVLEKFGVQVVKNNFYNRVPLSVLIEEHKDWKNGIPSIFDN